MKRAVSDNILILYVITFVLILLGQILGSLLQFIPFMTGSPAMITMTMYLAFIGIFIAVFVQSSAEELLCRGFLYQRLMRSYKKPIVAIVGNSLFSALLHLANDGVTVLSMINIFVVGILFSLMVYYMDSIWCSMALPLRAPLI